MDRGGEFQHARTPGRQRTPALSDAFAQALREVDVEVLRARLRAACTVERAGGTADKVLMIGDSINDILAARNGNIPSIAVPFGYSDVPVEELGASHVIAHFDELTVELVERLTRAGLASMAFTLIDKVAKILKPFDNPIHVEGFTDDQPIRTAQFPTNWELSAARAASIVRMLAMQGVNPQRLASVGYGEFQPLADNATAEGRTRNRRVVLVISRNLDVRRSISGVGSANAQPDSALRRAGMQPAAQPEAVAPPSDAVNSQSPVP